MADSNVSISFGADASDFLEGVARVSAALQTLPAGVTQVAQGVERSSQSFAAFGAGATNALTKIAQIARDTGASQQDLARASMMAINGEISAERAALAEKKSLFAELTKLKVMSAGERLEATQAALDAEYASERSLLEKELQIDGLRLQQRQQILNRMLMLDAKYAQDSQKIMLQSVEQMVAPMNRMIDSMSSSLSSGLTGMIEGTKNFRQVVQSPDSVGGIAIRQDGRRCRRRLGQETARAGGAFHSRRGTENGGGAGWSRRAKRRFGRRGGGRASVDFCHDAQKHHRFGVGILRGRVRLSRAGHGASGRRPRRRRARRGHVGGGL